MSRRSRHAPAELVYPAASVVARLGFRALDLRIRVVGDGLVPVAGPAVLASNHVSFLDFVFVGLAARHSGRRVRFLCRSDIWEHWPGGPLMRSMRHIPVVSGHGAGAFLTARTMLSEGEVVGVFPEGGVSRAYVVRPILPGAVRLAMDTGAPLLPVAVWGPQRLWPVGAQPSLRRHRAVTVLVGDPLPVDSDGDVVEQTRSLRGSLQRLLDRAQAEHLDRPSRTEPAPWHPAHLGGDAPTPKEAVALEDRPQRAIA